MGSPPNRNWTRVDWILIAAAALWALALRLLFLAVAGRHPFFATPIMDMAYHDEWARRIVAGDFWGSEPFFRAPLYPYFLALLYKLTGGSVLGARVIQAFVGGASAALCFLAGRELFDRRVGVAAAFLLGTLWTAVYNDVELLLVVLEIPLGLALLFAATRAAAGLKVGWGIAAGLAFGLAAITRPNFLLVGLGMPLAFAAPYPGRGFPWRRWLPVTLAFFAAAGILVGAVTLRNGLVGRDPVLIAWQGGVNCWIGNNPESDGMTAIVPGTYGDWWRGHYESIRIAEKAEGRRLKPSEVDRYYYRRVAAYAGERPGRFLWHLLRKAYFFTNAYEVANNFDENYLRKIFPVLRYNPVSLYIILPGALFGALAFLRRWRQLAPLYVFLALFSASVVAFFVNSRFRMPITPALAILAAAAFFLWWDNARSWGWKGVAARGLALALAFVWCDADPFKMANRSAYESQAHYTMGSVYLQAGDVDAAEVELKAALASEYAISHADALNDLGIIAARKGDYKQAEEYWRRETEVQPSYAKGWNNLGNLALARGDLKEARGYYEAALKADPADARGYYFYGRLLAREGDLAGARAKWKAAVSYQPNFAEAWYELGRAAAGDGDWRAAREYYLKAVYWAPASPAAREGLADAEYALGDFPGAERDYRLRLSQGETARVRYNLACVLARTGRGEEAIPNLRRAIALEPGRYKPLAAKDADLAPLRALPEVRELLRP